MLGCLPAPPDLPPSPTQAPVVWEQPAPGVAAVPAVLATPDGAFVLAWEGHEGERRVVRAARREPSGEWGTAVRLDADADGEGREPRLAGGAEGRVLAAWQGVHAGSPIVLAAVSADAGRTWLPDRPVSDRAGAATLPAVAVDPDGRMFVAWEDRTDGERDLRLLRSTDSGASWEPSIRVDSDAAGRASSFHPALATPGSGVVLVLWWDDRNGLSDLFVRRSSDAGVTWAGPEVRLDDGPAGATVSHAARWSPAPVSDTVTVRWEEVDAAGIARLRERASPDRGATWGVVRSAEGGEPSAPGGDTVWAVSAAGDTLIVRLQPGAAGPELRATIRSARARADPAGGPG